MEAIMKHTKQLFFTILSILSIQVQAEWNDWKTRKLDQLENDQYPLDFTKTITFTMPNPEENIWVYVERYNSDLKTNVSQRMLLSKEISKQTLTLVKPSSIDQQIFQVSYIPQTHAEIYLNYLKEKAPKDGVVFISNQKNDPKKQHEMREKDNLMENNFHKAKREIITLDYRYIQDGQLVTIPPYEREEQPKPAPTMEHEHFFHGLNETQIAEHAKLLQHEHHTMMPGIHPIVPTHAPEMEKNQKITSPLDENKNEKPEEATTEITKDDFK